MTDRTKDLMRLMASESLNLFRVCTMIEGAADNFYIRYLWMTEGLMDGYRHATDFDDHIDFERVLRFRADMLTFYERRIHEEV